MNDGQERRQENADEGRQERVLTERQQQELHDLARNMKGIYVRVVRLLHDLDIAFKSY